jgi:integrase
MLAVLLGCGLRRRELIDLTVDHLQRREDHWAIVDLVGKGGHIRTVPMPDWVKESVDDWLSPAKIAHGRIFRCVCRRGVVWGTKITEKVVWHVVKEYAEKLGISKLTPHDLRSSVLPRFGGRVGANPVFAWPCLSADNGKIPRIQAAIPARRE